MAKAVEGTIIWYREKFARGVVMIEGGRRYMFTKTELEDLEPRLKVLVKNVAKGPAGIVIKGYEDGRREFAPEPKPMPIRRPAGTAGKRKKRGEPGIAHGLSVVHPQFGQGFVVSSTPKMARVRFTETGEERSCRISTVRVLDAQPAT
ncbi:MAG: hypothetical protein GY898_01380 [Proteobacteria bacterium]|nr:hypothetical protein [Pseudomonadota bacterium]